MVEVIEDYDEYLKNLYKQYYENILKKFWKKFNLIIYFSKIVISLDNFWYNESAYNKEQFYGTKY